MHCFHRGHSMDSNRLERIAGRVFVAFTCRRHVFETGFGYGDSPSGVVMYNYNYYPLLWAYPDDGMVSVVYTKKADDAFDTLCDPHYGVDGRGMGDVGEWINSRFEARPRARSVRNMRVLLWNYAHNYGMRGYEDAEWLVSKRETLSYDEALKLLTGRYELSLIDFRRAFGGEGSDEQRFECCGMQFEVNGSSLDRDDVCAKMNAVKSALPSSFAELLLYGKVEMKDKFHGNTLADYNPQDDTIRVDASDNFFVSMIHELGHRWHYKFCKPSQERRLMALYRKCKGGGDIGADVKVGDVVRLTDGREFKITGVDGAYFNISMIDGNSSLNQVHRLFFTQYAKHIESVNGRQTKSLPLPRPYAGKNFREFIACCFEHIYGGRPVSDALRKMFKEIVEEE